MRTRRNTRSVTLPAPIAGWNARDPLVDMQPTEAIDLLNMIPDGTELRIRGGCRVHSSGMGTGVVPSLFELYTEAGTRRLIACANGNIYNATTAGGTASSLKSGLSENYWQGVVFKNKLILVNGTDQPQQYDGSSISDATYTGVTDNDLINVSHYRERLYFVEKASTSFWYGGSQAVTGGLTEYDLGYFLQKGGVLLFAGTWTRGQGDTTEDLFVAVTDQGEVLLYTGSYPGDASWALVGRYFCGRPLGRRAVVNIGSDLVVITEDGAWPLSQVMASEGATDFAAITDKIRNAFREAARLYKANLGWSACVYPQRSLLLFNIPLESTGRTEQYVLNTASGAWTRFSGCSARAMVNYNGKLFFGGNDGKVYEFDYGFTDNSMSIPVSIEPAFSNMGQPGRLKRFLMARPLITADNAVSFAFNCQTDYSRRISTETVNIDADSGSSWDVAEWDTAKWADGQHSVQEWYGLAGMGRTASIQLKGNFKNVDFRMSAMDVIYELAGVI